ncbi:hypothetical protein NP88_3096 [Burkholderia cepacia]|jgi:hypothetical protein|nr:hypothetical protein NP88_3096 [Burkholderia cepacia]QNN06007.1 hypothetical protein K562_20226 [Burkholderia cenocepacia]SPU81903.1 Uncharacterised protein [Burkholderia cenocepacia]SPV03455.1 Uncharacterised protein [Burkholderia cenocepacia]
MRDIGLMANTGKTHTTITRHRPNSAKVVTRFRMVVRVTPTCEACDEMAIDIRGVNERGPQVHEHLRAADHHQLSTGVSHG